MGKDLNFTNVYLPHPRGKVEGYIILGVINQGRVIEDYILSGDTGRYELVPFGDEVYFYNFLIVTKKQTILDGLESLISPFDKITWILVILSCTGVIIMFQLQPEQIKVEWRRDKFLISLYPCFMSLNANF